MVDQKTKLSESLALIRRHAYYGDVTQQEAQEVLKSINEFDEVQYEVMESKKSTRLEGDPLRDAEFAAEVGLEHYFEQVRRKHRRFAHISSYAISELRERTGDERLKLSIMWLDTETATYQKSITWRDPRERKTYRAEERIDEDSMEDALISLEHFRDFTDRLVAIVENDEILSEKVEPFKYQDIAQEFDEEEVNKIVAEEVERQIDYSHFYDDDQYDESIKKQADRLREAAVTGEELEAVFIDDQTLESNSFTRVLEAKEEYSELAKEDGAQQ